MTKLCHLTPWFPASINPVHVGPYEVRGREHWNHRHYLIGRPCRHWDGKVWRAWDGGPQSIFGDSKTHEWRGLADRPTAKGAAGQEDAAHALKSQQPAQADKDKP